MNGRTHRTVNCASIIANCDLLHNNGNICWVFLRLAILPGPTLYRDIYYILCKYIYDTYLYVSFVMGKYLPFQYAS